MASARFDIITARTPIVRDPEEKRLKWKGGRLLNLILEILGSPSTGLRRALAEKPWGLAILLIVVADLFTTIAGAQTPGEIGQIPFLPENPWLYLLLVYPFGLALSFLFWLLGSLLVYGLARLFGGKGTYSDTLLILAFIQAPFLLSLVLDPLALLRVGLDLNGLPSSIISWGIQTGILALGVWAFVLALMGLTYVHGFTYGRAALSACLPPCGCLILVVVLVVVAVIIGGAALLPALGS